VLDSISKITVALVMIMVAGACASRKTQNDPTQSFGHSYTQTIDNPFSETGWGESEGSQNITLRSKHGDQSVEVMIPKKYDSDLEIPMNYTESAKSSAYKDSNLDYSYKDSKPTVADREIASTFNSVGNYQDEKRKRDIEQSLGMQEVDELPAMDQSYLAKLDIVKQLFKSSRYEAAMIELDRMVKEYPTDAKLYEMRGTLLDRMGYQELALRSWKQSLEFKPDQVALKKVVDKRELQRGVASQKVENR